MKNKVYVERYAERLIAGDKLAVAELFECFVNEYNADAKRLHVTTNETANRLLSEYNRKGNELANMMRVKTGMTILNQNWFSRAVQFIREAENGGAENDKP